MERKILFAVPTNSKIEASTVFSIVKICQRPDIEYLALTGSPIEQVRNAIVNELLSDQTLTHVMMMDSDIVPPDGIVDMLLECDSPMACGICPVVLEGTICTNIVGITEERPDGQFLTRIDPEKGPFELNAAGTGVVLIRREVFENVPWPWFKRQEKRDIRYSVGEDIYFSRKAAKAGYKYIANPKAICGHIKPMDLMKIVGAFNEKYNDNRKS